MVWPSLRRLGLLAMGSVGVTTLAFAGCGGQTTPGYSNQGKDAACAEFCEHTAECSDDVDVAECTEACTDDEVLSRSGQDLLTECFAGDECETVASLDAIACLEDGLFDLTLTEAQEAFCTLSLERIAECGGNELGEEDADRCLSGVAALSEEFVTELSECGERRTCDLVNACVGLQVLTSLNQDQLEDLLGGEPGTGGLGAFGDLEDLFGSIGGSLGGAGPG